MSACSMDEKPGVRKTRWAQCIALNHRSVILPSSTNPGQNRQRVRAEDGWQRNAGAQGHGHVSPVLLQLLCCRGFCSIAGQAEGTGGWQEPRPLPAGGEQRGGWRGGKQRGADCWEGSGDPTRGPGLAALAHSSQPAKVWIRLFWLARGRLAVHLQPRLRGIRLLRFPWRASCCWGGSSLADSTVVEIPIQRLFSKMHE